MKNIIDLKNIPLVNNLFNTPEESLRAKKYPLRIKEYENLIMKLDLDINSDEMFSNYLYRSSVNLPYVEHCKKMWQDIAKYNPQIILDIGGNDGALLNAFRAASNKNLRLVNVDASASFKDDNQNLGIEYHNAYWGDIELKQKADIIISTNVFQHNPNYKKFLEGIKNNLNGRWILEFPYFLETVKTNQFDQIYHEHVYYWLVTPLVKLFHDYGLKILNISEQDIHGGSLRIISSNIKEDKENEEVINKYLNLEKEFNFGNWQDIIDLKISKDREFLNNINGDIAAFGAAAKGCVYVNYAGIQDKIKYIIDDTVQKQNKYMPGTKLEINSREILRKDRPDYILILAHNFKDFIISSLRKYGYQGKFIVMLPEIKLID